MRLLSDVYGKTAAVILMTAILGGCGEAPAAEVVLPSGAAVIRSVAEVAVEVEKPQYQTVDSRGYLDEVYYSKGIREDFSDLTFEYVPLESMQVEDLKGAVVPHHGPAYSFMADVYRLAGHIHQTKPYDLVVVIGPNHHSVGAAIQVSEVAFETYEGVLECDFETAEALIEGTEAVSADIGMLAQEHSQLIQMPFIHYFLQGVPVLSVTITESGNAPSVLALADGLMPFLEDKHVLILASIDFSHGLSLEEALKMDETTLQYLLASDGRTMQYLRDDHLDAPSTYLLLTELMEGLEADQPVVTNHSNSALILNGVQAENTTSYFQVLYPSRSPDVSCK